MTTSFIQSAVEGVVGGATGRAAGAFATGTPLPDSPFSNRPVPSGFEQTPLPTFTQRPKPSTVTDSSSRVNFEDDSGQTGRSYTLTGQVVKGGPGYDYSMDISPIRGGPQFRRTAAGVKEPDFGVSYLTYLVDQKMQGTQRYDPVTGTTKADFPGALSMAIPSPLGAFAGLGQAISQANLERIAKNAYIGEDGFAVASLNGRTIGVSPSPFGGHVLSGVLPDELSPSQRQQITQKLLEISKTEDASGAYMGPDPTAPKGQTVAESESGAGQFTGDGDDYQQTPAPAYTAPPQITYTTDPGQDDPAPTTTSQDFSASSPSSNQSSYETEAYGDYGQYRARGGRVGMADGGSADPVQSTGFVDGPPQNYAEGTTVADTENHRVRVGSFVLNAPTTERLQEEGKLPKGPQKRKAAKGGRMMDVALSKGEYVIDADDISKFGGYDTLNKENDKGKPEVERRQAAAQGGFLGGYSDGGMLRYAGPLSAVELMKSGLNVTTPTPSGFIQQKEYDSGGLPPYTVNNIDIGAVQKALTLVETRGYEDRNEGYFFTRSDKTGKESSAFGPLQITKKTLEAMKTDRFGQLDLAFDTEPGLKKYYEKLITEGRNALNVKKYEDIYIGPEGSSKKTNASEEEKAKYRGLGYGNIPLEEHKKYYPTIAALYMRYKAGMSDSEEDLVRRHFGNNLSTQKYYAAKEELGINQ